MNDKQGLGNGASAETQEIQWLISEYFPGARILLMTCYDIMIRYKQHWKISMYIEKWINYQKKKKIIQSFLRPFN